MFDSSSFFLKAEATPALCKNKDNGNTSMSCLVWMENEVAEKEILAQ